MHTAANSYVSTSVDMRAVEDDGTISLAHDGRALVDMPSLISSIPTQRGGIAISKTVTELGTPEIPTSLVKVVIDPDEESYYIEAHIDAPAGVLRGAEVLVNSLGYEVMDCLECEPEQIDATTMRAWLVETLPTKED